MQIIKLTKAKDIATYQPPASLEAVMDMAITLGRPLLLAGQPGTGKTQFAHWYANQQNDFNSKVFQFNTKSTSVFTDLFYEYDAVSHFRDANIQKLKETGLKTAADYITLTALGFAIVCAKGLENIEVIELKKIIANTKPKFSIESSETLCTKTVVLIDEIDKAPREFPNDLLHEIENLSFTIKEINQSIQLADELKQNIVIILTSNDEKNLPDAFLRRCLFYYIDFPSEDRLREIVSQKLGLTELDSSKEEHFKTKMVWFRKIYNTRDIDKKPSTSECIDWINYLNKHGLLDKPYEECVNSFSILIKKKADLDRLESILK